MSDAHEMITRLLARAAKTNHPAEAALCRERAATLMLRHGITEGDLKAGRGEADPVTVRTVSITGVYARADMLVMTAVIDGSGVGRVLYRRAGRDRILVDLYAHTSDSRSAALLCEAILAGAHLDLASWWKSERDTYAGWATEHAKLKARRSYLYGYALGLEAEMKAARRTVAAEPGTALVLADRTAAVDKHIADELGDVKTSRALAAETTALNAGTRDGRKAAPTKEGLSA